MHLKGQLLHHLAEAFDFCKQIQIEGFAEDLSPMYASMAGDYAAGGRIIESLMPTDTSFRDEAAFEFLLGAVLRYCNLLELARLHLSATEVGMFLVKLEAAGAAQFRH